MLIFFIGRTLPCFNCDIGMARGGHLWDEQFCPFCPNTFGQETISWRDLEERKVGWERGRERDESP
jgi:hypothetical protein